MGEGDILAESKRYQPDAATSHVRPGSFGGGGRVLASQYPVTGAPIGRSCGSSGAAMMPHAPGKMRSASFQTLPASAKRNEFAC